MKVKYKKSGVIAGSSMFNTSTVGEVLTGDDSAYIKELDVWLEALQEWKDMPQAFKDHDLIADNFNTCFFEPRNEEDRKRGYSL